MALLFLFSLSYIFSAVDADYEGHLGCGLCGFAIVSRESWAISDDFLDLVV